MTYWFELVLVVLVLVTAATAILSKDLISAVFILAAYSFFLALVWAWLGAVDLAFVEAVVGAGLSTVFLLLTISQMRLEDTAVRRSPPPLAVLLALPPVAVLLLYAATDLPAFGDAASPAHLHIAPYYVEQSVADTRTPNVVTSIIMDYRGFDTLIETCVIFTAGIACAAVLRKG
jgi:multicomponent Na+:H+ antiporter subunit B